MFPKEIESCFKRPKPTNLRMPKSELPHLVEEWKNGNGIEATLP
jgi:hypothetical protein